MSIKKMKKEDLELMSYKDITNLILQESKPKTTLDLFTKIIKLLDLPENTIEKQIGDYYTMLSTDKRFLLLEDNKWDLRSRHTSDKVIKIVDSDDEEEEIEAETLEEEEELDKEEDFDNQVNDEDDFDDGEDDLKGLVIFDPSAEEEE